MSSAGGGRGAVRASLLRAETQRTCPAPSARARAQVGQWPVPVTNADGLEADRPQLLQTPPQNRVLHPLHSSSYTTSSHTTRPPYKMAAWPKELLTIEMPAFRGESADL
ncbi:unnamed protein product [Rangifer tarandus platyrhynchus]|uniref:Uncharacterized protein n=2 Tax=Rangifer tarandus platyrhynchus TaxID=3082113 RepID=A0ACB0FBF8_RANTA|nr:unnamed protein product [Rangifer tarandus platyrhynchus]CAI9710188.1 unnamed protein product [Rangifer tarandus platyrhynchus]